MLETQLNLKKIGINVASLYEIGFSLRGRASIYFTSFIVFISSFFIIVVYTVLMGQMCTDVVTGLFNINNKVMTSPNFWKFLLMVILLPYHLPREMKEIKFAARVLFFGILAFLAIMIYEMVVTNKIMKELPVEF
jgi:hypothetical protein